MENPKLPDLLNDEQYQILYVKYKVWVEHRSISKRLLKSVSQETSRRLLMLYEEEKAKFLQKANRSFKT